MPIPMPFALSFGMSDQTSNSSNSPVSFGAVNIGSGSASGGASLPLSVSQSPVSTLIPVATATSQTVPGLDGVNPNAGASNPLGGFFPSVLGAGMGLNGNQVQAPPGVFGVIPASERSAGVEPASGGGLPSIGIIALAGAALVALLIMAR